MANKYNQVALYDWIGSSFDTVVSTLQSYLYDYLTMYTLITIVSTQDDGWSIPS
jgi:hypothetical protein